MLSNSKKVTAMINFFPPASRTLALQCSYSWNRQTSVNHDDLAGGIGKIAANQRRNGLAHIFGGAPTTLDCQSFGEQLVILLFDASGHIRFDNARPDFVDRNMELPESRRPEL